MITLYVMGDYTGKYAPSGWANEAIDAYIRHQADAIVYEKNYGGDMVERVLRAELDRRGMRDVRLVAVTSRRGKDVRAEPIVALYEKTEVFHVGERGDMGKLEEEMTIWVPHPKEGRPLPSPNRIDALVHGLTDLARRYRPSEVANPLTLLRDRRAPRNPWL